MRNGNLIDHAAVVVIPAFLDERAVKKLFGK